MPLCLILYLFFAISVLADEHTHRYAADEEVVLWMNTVGPYHNRQETYNYFSLPFCKGPKTGIEHYHETLGEALQGVELAFSGLDIRFKTSVSKRSYCERLLNAEDLELLMYSIKNQYWYQMYLDDLPIWGIVGEFVDDEFFIWTHKRLSIGYNGDQIVDVNLTSGDKTPIRPGMSLYFSYEVSWVPSQVAFENRFDKYLDAEFFQHRIHWFSIFNSFMMVIFLVALVFMILLRTLRKDYARYNKEDDLERELGDEYGWKQIHGDVFRPPPHAIALCSLVSTGFHVMAVTLIMAALCLVMRLYIERGSIVSTSIFLYSVLSCINGFVGGALYNRMEGKKWIRQFITGATCLPILVCSVAFLINFVAVYYHASRAIPFLTMLAVFAILIFVVLPLNLIGCVLGRNLAGQPSNPCRIYPVPRPIPDKKWFMNPPVVVLLSGLLPFGSIFIEMYFIFTSFWAYKIYFVFGFTLLVLFILFIVTSSVTIVSTYFLLNSEDYRWQWTGFGCGASTAIYVYGYAIYYFLFRTRMFGFFQTSFFFGYMALFCFSLGTMCGAIGYISSSLFLRKIYSTVKID